MGTCDVFDMPLQQIRSNRRSNTRTLHRVSGGIRTVGTTNYGVMINGSHRRELIVLSRA